MAELIIGVCAFLASLITFYSGFGLGTLLMPIMAIFVPVELAIGITAIVHLLNNIFKFTLVAKQADISIVKRFGISAIIFAFWGAWLLTQVGNLTPLFSYDLFGKKIEIMPIEFTIGLIIIFFSIFELIPKLKEISIDKKYMPLGGALAGFFGGLSGIQGAFRTMFLIKSGMTKEGFIATGVVIAVLVDLSRLLIYGLNEFHNQQFIFSNSSIILVATISAFMGTIVGKVFAQKITISWVQKIVAISLFIIGVCLMLGIV